MPFRLENQAEPIPGYKLIERLGSGGFGEVWKAEAPGGLLKAIKFVYGDLDPNKSEGVRAEQELKSLDRVKMVRHPYILSLERFDIIDGQLMIVMELADRNLWDRFRDCRTQGLPGIPRVELLGYLGEAAEALDLMNNQYQLQHLDIKPQNLFLVYNHIKVADFGLVKALQGRVASVTGGVTPIYAAPEMFDGWVSRYCDQYSLAIVYQELLTGHRPFVATNVHQLIMQHVQGKPNLSSLPAAEQEVIGRALAKTPEERYPSCAELVRVLRSLGGAAPSPVPLAVPVSAPATTHVTPTRAPEPAPPQVQTPSPVATPPPMNKLHEGTNGSQQVVEESVPQQARTEVRGEGELVPAVVIGLGQAALGALQQLHEVLVERFGTRGAVPHIRLLYLDTDPTAVHGAIDPALGPALPRHEVLLARLNRASHYLKPREGRPGIETWFNTNVLYRIQRSQVTGGLRALGRLAFFDNYRAIAQRLRHDLESCADPEAVEAAARQTGLSLRSNRPRVYVVTGLAGGSGGGMFIDLAYVARRLLRQLGYARPEVIGALLLPAPGKGTARKMAQGNAYAALTELNHFSAPDVTFTARYDSQEPPLTDPDPPFSRCVVLPLPEGGSEEPATEVTGLLSQFIYRDLLTPLGRLCDAERARQHEPSPRLRVSAIGMYRFSWPRRALLQRVGRRLCLQLARRWMSKDGKPVQAAVGQLVQEQWTKMELAADAMIARLHAACERALGLAPESAFASAISRLGTADRARGAAPEAVLEAIDQLDNLVGRPSALAVLNRPGALEEVLGKEADAVVAEWGDKLAKLTLPLIEEPEFRLAGAEEAIRQVICQIEQVLHHQEPLWKELTDKAAKATERLDFLRQNVPEILSGGRRTAPVVAELFELLRVYPKWRYQSLVLRRVNVAYTSLRGYLSDQVRDLSFCRVRLGELVQSLEGAAMREASEAEAPGHCFLFAAGCRGVDDMVEQFVGEMGPADFEDLDRRVQQMIRQQFRALGHVCSASANLLKNLHAAMMEEAVAFAGERLADDDVVEMYLGRHASEQEAVDHLAEAFREAAPKIALPDGPDRAEIALLAAPDSPARERLRALADAAAGGAALVEAASPDDIVFFRELAHVALSDLEQVGPAAQEAFDQMAAGEHVTPHCRTDIVDWQTVTPE